MKDWARGLLYEVFNPKPRWERLLFRYELAALALLAAIFIIRAWMGGDVFQRITVLLVFGVGVFVNRLLLALRGRVHGWRTRNRKR